MAAGDRIISSGIKRGQLIPQEGITFSDNEYGLDDGLRTYLTHPNTPRTQWPQVRDEDALYPQMYVVRVVPRILECGLTELAVEYRGIVRRKPEKIVLDGDSPTFPISALVSNVPTTILVPIPTPAVIRTYVTTKEPNLNGIGLKAAGKFLPAVSEFPLTWTPNSDEPQTINYLTGWILQSRSSEAVAGKIYEVRERYTYNHLLAV